MTRDEKWHLLSNHHMLNMIREEIPQVPMIRTQDGQLDKKFHRPRSPLLVPLLFHLGLPRLTHTRQSHGLHIASIMIHIEMIPTTDTPEILILVLALISIPTSLLTMEMMD
jgi:hypothetical protein